ncbi:MAG: rhodanese-like domain-containing protein [Desulfocapsaceae bacterium]
MKTLITAVLIFLFATAATAAQYNFMAAEELKKRIDSNDDILIIDIQVEEDFRQHHIPGSLATHAYPVKTSDDLTRLDPVVKLQQNDTRPVVIVCPRGAGGAKRTHDYLMANGILKDRLWILEKGMSGWEYNDLITALN